MYIWQQIQHWGIWGQPIPLSQLFTQSLSMLKQLSREQRSLRLECPNHMYSKIPVPVPNIDRLYYSICLSRTNELTHASVIRLSDSLRLFELLSVVR